MSVMTTQEIAAAVQNGDVLLYSAEALHRFGARLGAEMVAAGYPAEDMVRFGGVLRDALEGYGGPVRYRVGAAATQVLFRSDLVEQLVLEKGGSLSRNRYRLRGGILSLVTCRVLH